MVVMFQEGRDADAIAITSLVAGLLVVISAALYGGYEVALRLAVGNFVLAYSPYSPLQEPMGFPVTGSGVLLLLLSGIMAVVFNVFLPLSMQDVTPGNQWG
ncbi:hypothetical protein GN244_ATG20145 [Phytophthora infestans]|uniref:Uncharacterized protein n=1 Tax=Phytophthora infestans TaxID=4787 RepID=A0A833W3I8_PHYIN|nr:hypothetical protein GN244_ATG20145 [Phytophthora infestans]